MNILYRCFVKALLPHMECISRHLFTFPPADGVCIDKIKCASVCGAISGTVLLACDFIEKL